MLNITKLYCEKETPGDELRYKKGVSHRRPIVVWNSTRRCNLKCVHCYSDSKNKEYEGELTTDEAKSMISDLSDFKVPVLLFSGGEPLLREDIFDLIEFTIKMGIKVAISTNGTVINKIKAKQIKDLGVRYVGISLDGIGEINDKFRGVEGAFEAATKAFHALKDAGQRAGLRLTLTRTNYQDVSQVFDFIEDEKIPRVCFYHLVYTGRGAEIKKDDLTHKETRQVVDLIIDRTHEFHKRGKEVEVLTVDNHSDGVYLYKRMKGGKSRARRKSLSPPKNKWR